MKKTVLWTLRRGRVSDIALDINGDGDTLFSEKLQMLRNSGAQETCKKSKRCSDTDHENLEKMRGSLQSIVNNQGIVRIDLFKTHDLPPLGEFTSDRRFATPSGNPEIVVLAEFLTVNEPTVIVECTDQKLIQAADTGDQGSANKSGKKSSILDKVKTRGSVADLTKSIKKASAATFTVTNDDLAGTRSYDLDVVVGYPILGLKNADLLLDNPAYVGVDRFRVSGGGGDVDEVTLGLLSQAQFRGILGNHVVSFRPKYAIDSSNNTSIGAATVTWAPVLGPAQYNPLISPIDLKVIPFWFGLKLEGQLHGGHVFDDGGQTEIAGSNNFLRAGGHIRTQFFGAENSIFERFTWDTHYTRLHVLEGPFNSIRLFETELAITLDPKKHFTLNLAYSNGRKSEQLKDTDLWKLGFGVKF